MPKRFLGVITYQQPIEDANIGTRNEEFIKQQTVNDSYLFDAVSYTDAEARVYQEIAANTPDFEIKDLRRMKLADVFFHHQADGASFDGETWYKVKAMFITDDEKTGKQKKTPSLMLVNAHTPREAIDRIEDHLKSSLDPFEITDINTTKILEVFPYVAESDRPLVPLAEVVEQDN